MGLDPIRQDNDANLAATHDNSLFTNIGGAKKELRYHPVKRLLCELR